MSIDLALKVGIGLLGASAASAGSYELYRYLTTTLEDKYSLLSETDNKWSQLVKKYEEATKDEQTNKPQKMENFEFSNSEPNNDDSKKQELINHCKKILKTSLREEEITLKKREKEVKSWCVKTATALVVAAS